MRLAPDMSHVPSRLIVPQIGHIQGRCEGQGIFLHSPEMLTSLSNGVLGAGFQQVTDIVNVFVDKNYAGQDPLTDLGEFLEQQGVAGPCVGLMTAVLMERASWAHASGENSQVSAIVTAGLGNAASAGVTPPFPAPPGTINTIVLIDGHLSQGALVNSLITATEAKSGLLAERGILTSAGDLATGTTSDAIVVAATGQGKHHDYAGTSTELGYLIGHCVRRALAGSLQRGQAGPVPGLGSPPDSAS